MKRHAVLLITLFYVVGTTGIPLAAYSCVETGKAGVVAYLSGSPGSCYVDSCCDEDPDASGVRIRNDSGCCYLDIQGAREGNLMLLPNPKHGAGELPPRALSRFDASLPDLWVLSARPAISPFHAPINLPLLI
jgi:hypothetical protein